MELSETTRDQIRQVAEERGLRLLEVSTAGAGRYTTLRVVLERGDGESVTLDECESVSREVSGLLDATDEIPHKYSLEVSSAGLDRKLYSLEDAKRFVGRRVRVKSDVAIEATPEPGRIAGAPARNFAGVLASIDGDRLTVFDDENRRTYNVRFGETRQVRLDYEWPARQGV
ncbi:MAG TPA: ribosome maturation factor RimP [Thermoanaerobaculia bacterium]|jgi:ribosome maturation factor RimP